MKSMSFYPALNRKDIIATLRFLINDEQLERLSSMRFKGKVSFKLNAAHFYEGRIFKKMCSFGITPDRLCELRWANTKYKKGEYPVRGKVKNIP